MKRFEIVANKGKDVIYKNFKDDELSFVLFAWELRMRGYVVKEVQQVW